MHDDDFDPDSDPNDPLDCDLDEPDNEPAIACPYCAGIVHEDAPKCPHCGQWIITAHVERRTSRLWIIAALLAIMGMLTITLW